MQHTATHCNTLQHTATIRRTCANSLVHAIQKTQYRLQHAAAHWTATHCNTLQHTATRCNTLQHTELQHTAAHWTATHCNTLQHTATHCNTLHLLVAPEPICWSMQSWKRSIKCVEIRQRTELQHTATHCNTLQLLGAPELTHWSTRSRKHSIQYVKRDLSISKETYENMSSCVW